MKTAPIHPIYHGISHLSLARLGLFTEFNVRNALRFFSFWKVMVRLHV